MDDIDKALINRYQSDFPLDSRPFATLGADLNIDEQEVMQRIDQLLNDGTLTRFGPLFDIEACGGQFTLAAVKAHPERLEITTEIINSFREVAHNYERDHELNLWFVIACEHAEQTEGVIHRLERATGLRVYAFPKEHEFFINLRFEL